MATAAQQILALYTDGQWPYVDNVVKAGHSETLHVDFKQKHSPATATFDKDDKRNLAEALSGFANAEGGLIVWGIDARRVGDVDQAVRLAPLQDVRGVLSELAQLTPEMASPPILGVTHSAIVNPIDSNVGVVLTYVPESDRGPHMARGPGQHRYYRRNGNRFSQLEHYEVADLFGRRAHPVLEVRTSWGVEMVGYSAGEGATARVNIHFTLENHGRGLAMYPSLTLAQPSGSYRIAVYTGQHGGAHPLRSVPAPRNWWLRFAGGADTVVYPDDEFEAAYVGLDTLIIRNTFSDMEIPYRAVAAGAQPTDGVLHLTGTEIRAALAAEFARNGRGFPAENE